MYILSYISRRNRMPQQRGPRRRAEFPLSHAACGPLINQRASGRCCARSPSLAAPQAASPSSILSPRASRAPPLSSPFAPPLPTQPAVLRSSPRCPHAQHSFSTRAVSFWLYTTLHNSTCVRYRRASRVASLRVEQKAKAERLARGRERAA